MARRASPTEATGCKDYKHDILSDIAPNEASPGAPSESTEIKFKQQPERLLHTGTRWNSTTMDNYLNLLTC